MTFYLVFVTITNVVVCLQHSYPEFGRLLLFHSDSLVLPCIWSRESLPANPQEAVLLCSRYSLCIVYNLNGLLIYSAIPAQMHLDFRIYACS